MNRAFLLGFALLAMGCGKKTFDSLCAVQVPPPAECNTPCDPAPGAPSACSPGFHCSADGKCDTFCTAAGGECGDGYVCTADGRCEDDGGSDDPIIDAPDCPSVRVMGTKKTPTVELLLDQSGSMTEDYGNTDRWNAMRNALVDNTNGVVKRLEGSVVFGATLYSGPDSGACPVTTSRPRMLNNFNAIRDLLQTNPAQNTPTGPSIDRVVASFAANPPAAGSPPIILLATDGLPDTCTDRNPPDAARQEAANQVTVQAAQRAHAAGIQLYFLFIGNAAEAGTHPQQMANVGVGKAAVNPAGGNAPFYQANSPADLVAAFNTIIGNVVSCDVKLSGQVSQADAPSGVVVVNGRTLTYGTEWTLDADNITIHVLGDACTALKNAAAPTIEATFPCGTIIF